MRQNFQMQPHHTLLIIILLVFMPMSYAQIAPEANAIGLETQQSGSQFTPVVRMLGATTADNTLEWYVTVTNTGDLAGRNVVLTDELVDVLRVDNVQINTGTASINGQTITIVIPTLEVGQTVQFTVITTPLVDATDTVISNTICVRADNYVGEECAFAVPIQALPATGETPQWRTRLQQMSLLGMAISLFMIGFGLMGWRAIHN